MVLKMPKLSSSLRVIMAAVFVTCFIINQSPVTASVIKPDEQVAETSSQDETAELAVLEGVAHTSELNDEKNSKLAVVSGAVFVRWGRTECPATSAYVYRGYSGSSTSATTGSVGGGSEIICLHETPNSQVAFSGTKSYIHGVEYEFAGAPFSAVNNGGNSLLNNDMPCVLCQAMAERTAQFMLPGRNVCPASWTTEYYGYLVAPANGYQKGAYTCVDSAPEAIASGGPSTNPNMIWPIGAECGTGVPCPPYVAGSAISCAVCTK